MSQPPRPGQPNPYPERTGTLIEGPGDSTRPAYPERSGTVLETDDDLRQALLSGLQAKVSGQSPQAVAAPSPPRAGEPAPGGRMAFPFRPTARPPVPLLTVFDDGRTEGEVIRLRSSKFVIGRTEGDLKLPMDGRVSARHVEITHQVVGGLHRWVVTDLQSMHGLYVRVSKTHLADRAEFLVGSGRYKFEAAQTVGAETVDMAPGETDTGATRGWNDGAPAFRPAALTELVGGEIGNRVLLVKDEYWIGSDPSCPVARPDDPFCEPRHARVHRSSKGGWSVEHAKTPNGLWLRMSQITVDTVVQFQVGEQRFKLKL